MTEFLEILTTNKKCTMLHAKGQTSQFCQCFHVSWSDQDRTVYIYNIMTALLIENVFDMCQYPTPTHVTTFNDMISLNCCQCQRDGVFSRSLQEIRFPTRLAYP